MITKKWMVASLIFLGAVLVALVASSMAVGNCGAGGCGVGRSVKACGADCTKPCCKTDAKACPADCTKPCCKTTAAAKPAEKVEDAEIDTPALKTLVRAKVSIVIVDARGVQKTRIPGAVAMNVRAKDEEIVKAVPDKNTLVVTYCGGPQCPLSTMLAKRMHGLGYQNVLEYRAGIRGWVASGGAVETVKQ